MALYVAAFQINPMFNRGDIDGAWGFAGRGQGVTAVVALLIGMLAVEDGTVPVSPGYLLMPIVDDLSPVFDGAPRNRGAGPAVDDETVGVMPPTVSGVVTIERRIIVRIPTLPRPTSEVRSFVPKAAGANSVSRKGATCLSVRSVKGATLDDKVGILFVTTGDSRYRADLERGCRPVDFQSGFYLNPAADGAICAGRDMLHARSGLRCAITGFTRLSPGM